MRGWGHPLTKNATTRAKRAILRHAFAQGARTLTPHKRTGSNNNPRLSFVTTILLLHTLQFRTWLPTLLLLLKGSTAILLLSNSDDEKDSIHCYCYDFSHLYNQALPPNQSPPRCHHGIATTNSNFFTLLLSAFFIPFV